MSQGIIIAVLDTETKPIKIDDRPSSVALLIEYDEELSSVSSFNTERRSTFDDVGLQAHQGQHQSTDISNEDDNRTIISSNTSTINNSILQNTFDYDESNLESNKRGSEYGSSLCTDDYEDELQKDFFDAGDDVDANTTTEFQRATFSSSNFLPVTELKRSVSEGLSVTPSDGEQDLGEFSIKDYETFEEESGPTIESVKESLVSIEDLSIDGEQDLGEFSIKEYESFEEERESPGPTIESMKENLVSQIEDSGIPEILTTHPPLHAILNDDDNNPLEIMSTASSTSSSYLDKRASQTPVLLTQLKENPSRKRLTESKFNNPIESFNFPKPPITQPPQHLTRTRKASTDSLGNRISKRVGSAFFASFTKQEVLPPVPKTNLQEIINKSLDSRKSPAFSYATTVISSATSPSILKKTTSPSLPPANTTPSRIKTPPPALSIKIPQAAEIANQKKYFLCECGCGELVLQEKPLPAPNMIEQRGSGEMVIDFSKIVYCEDEDDEEDKGFGEICMDFIRRRMSCF